MEPVVLLFEVWHIGLAANTVIAIACLALAWAALTRSDQADRMHGMAPAVLFMLLGAIHWVHAIVLAAPSILPSGEAGRAFLTDWRIYAVESLGAVVALAYLAMQLHLRGEQRIVRMATRTAERQREALRLHDEVVQALAAAKLALETRQEEKALALLEDGLEHAKVIITDLMKEDLSGPRVKHPNAGRDVA